jgi:hypothetical protein
MTSNPLPNQSGKTTGQFGKDESRANDWFLNPAQTIGFKESKN